MRSYRIDDMIFRNAIFLKGKDFFKMLKDCLIICALSYSDPTVLSSRIIIAPLIKLSVMNSICDTVLPDGLLAKRESGRPLEVD